ncbi:core histone H2A/H2B/H3/H4 [Ancylostoma ceylanicum]|uniref:Histone H2A n=2 Tax=Ancylostoma ceylanicum TaxID=53326 RepID=A0A016W5P6_9BILA|nr:core histone H2A/H2B/H3/H4 [Ancylostoma ceylanicum]EYC34572.1 hypothetical protein Y032_0001g475 [Ancylostoma ceylanicum]
MGTASNAPIDVYVPNLVGSAKSVRAGLVFPVARVHRALKNIRPGGRVSLKASIYLAAVLEYLVAEVVEIGGNASKDDGKRRIEPRHLCVAINFDAELNKLVNKAVFSEGGLVPASGLFEQNVIRL